MKSIKILIAVIVLLSSFLSYAEIKNISTENVKVSGSCALCKEGIEKAAFEKNISKASWDKDTKMALVTYDSKKTSIDAVLKKVALAVYDNDKFLAPDDAYAKLEDCCKYERTVKKQVVTEKEMAIFKLKTFGDAESIEFLQKGTSFFLFWWLIIT